MTNRDLQELNYYGKEAVYALDGLCIAAITLPVYEQSGIAHGLASRSTLGGDVALPDDFLYVPRALWSAANLGGNVSIDVASGVGHLLASTSALAGNASVVVPVFIASSSAIVGNVASVVSVDDVLQSSSALAGNIIVNFANEFAAAHALAGNVAAAVTVTYPSTTNDNTYGRAHYGQVGYGI